MEEANLIAIRRPIRTLLTAIVVIAAVAVAKSRLEQPELELPADDHLQPPIRVARDVSVPTIVEPNEGWLHEAPDEPLDDADPGAAGSDDYLLNPPSKAY